MKQGEVGIKGDSKMKKPHPENIILKSNKAKDKEDYCKC